jgi:hypothetical protein
MVTDTAFYRYAYYHTARDTPEKLSYAAMERIRRYDLFPLVRKLSRHTWPSASLPPAFTRCYRSGSMFTPTAQ